MSEQKLATPHTTQWRRLEELAETTDRTFVSELLEDFSRDGRRYLTEMMAAINADDAQGLFLAAHSLKSMGFSLGFDGLGRACKRVEAAASEGKVAGFAAELDVIRDDLCMGATVRSRWDAESMM